MGCAWRAVMLAALCLAGQAETQPDCPEALKGLLRDSRLADPAVVESFYRGLAFDLAWIRDGKPTTQALAMIEAFRVSNTHGLNPTDYESAEWPSRLSRLRVPADAVNLAGFDLALTVGAMRYV